MAQMQAQPQAQPAQVEMLKFDQRIANCENRWFGAKLRDGKIILGFVYIDPLAGFTFENYGSLNNVNGVLQATPTELLGKARLITRITQNFPATCLTDAQVMKLGLALTPESMKSYKDVRSLGEHHASWAYHYNHIGASDIALDHIAKAIEAGHASLGMTFEHAFAFNVLGRFDETIALLTPVVASTAKTSDIIAELAFAHLMQKQYPKAIELYVQAIDFDVEHPSQRRWEFARNIAAAYEMQGQIKERDQWVILSANYKKSKE